MSHVTIARLKGVPDRRLAEIVERVGRVAVREVQPRAVVLMQSELDPRGARYTPLFSVRIPTWTELTRDTPTSTTRRIWRSARGGRRPEPRSLPPGAR